MTFAMYLVLLHSDECQQYGVQIKNSIGISWGYVGFLGTRCYIYLTEGSEDDCPEATWEHMWDFSAGDNDSEELIPIRYAGASEAFVWPGQYDDAVCYTCE